MSEYVSQRGKEYVRLGGQLDDGVAVAHMLSQHLVSIDNGASNAQWYFDVGQLVLAQVVAAVTSCVSCMPTKAAS